MKRGIAWRVTVCVALSLSFAAGCTGGNGAPHHGSSSTADKSPVASVRPAWSVSSATLWHPGLVSHSPSAWTTPNAVVVAHDTSLVAYAPVTGKVMWTRTLPDAVCALAPTVNAAGVGAVLLGSGQGVSKDGCTTVAAVDTQAGRVLWSRSIKGLSEYGLGDVTIGASAVVVTNDCDRAVAFSTASGRELLALPAKLNRDGCVHSYATDGSLIVDGARPDKEYFDGYNAVTGRHLWRVPVHAEPGQHGANPQADGVVSEDPVVVDARVNNHRFLSRLDPTRKTVTAFGRQGSDSFLSRFFTVNGSRDVVAAYGQSPLLFTLDPGSGAVVRRTVLGSQEVIAGTRGSELITARSQNLSPSTVRVVFRGTDPVSGRRVVLGDTRTLGAVLGLSGDVLVMLVQGTSGEQLVGFRLPQSGPAVGTVPGLETGGVHFATGDARPADVADLCSAVSVATKKAMGFPLPDLPAPAACNWNEEIGDRADINVSVNAQALEPGPKQSADAAAHTAIRSLAKADSVNHLPALTPVAGLGDEAYAGTGRERSHALARVLVRVRNAQVTVDVLSDPLIGTTATKELAVTTRAARLVAADVVGELGRRLR